MVLIHKPVVSTQETTGFSIRNRWLPHSYFPPRRAQFLPRRAHSNLSIYHSIRQFASLLSSAVYVQNWQIDSFFAKSIFLGILQTYMLTLFEVPASLLTAPFRNCLFLGWTPAILHCCNHRYQRKWQTGWILYGRFRGCCWWFHHLDPSWHRSFRLSSWAVLLGVGFFTGD